MSLYLSSLFSMPCCSTSTMPLLLPFVASCCNATNGREYHYVFFFPTSTSFLSSTPSYFLFLFFLAWKLCHLEWDNALGFFFVRCWKKNMKLFFMALTRGQELVVATENHYLCGPWKAPGKKKFVVLRDQGAWGHFRVCQKVEQCAIIRVNQK